MKMFIKRLLQKAGTPLRVNVLLERIFGQHLWLWKHIVEPCVYACYLIYGHAHQWRVRFQWLRTQRIETLAWMMSIPSFLVGLVMCINHSVDIGSIFLSVIDDYLRPSAPTLNRLPFAPMPHQVLGGLLLVAAILTFVSIMEWPNVAGKEMTLDSAFDRNLLRRLMRMQYFGIMVAGSYWGANALLMLFGHVLWPSGWVCLSLAYAHFWVYQRVSLEFGKERRRAEEERRKRREMQRQIESQRQGDLPHQGPPWDRAHHWDHRQGASGGT